MSDRIREYYIYRHTFRDYKNMILCRNGNNRIYKDLKAKGIWDSEKLLTAYLLKEAAIINNTIKCGSGMLALYLESNHLFHGKKTLFIDDQAFVDFIMNTNIGDIELDELFKKDDSMSVAFSAKIKINNVVPEPFIFGDLSTMTYHMQEIGVNFIKNVLRAGICLNFNDHGLTSTWSSKTDLQKAINGTLLSGVDEIPDFLKDLVNIEGFTSYDKKILAITSSFCARLLVYLRAFPDSLIQDFPQSFKNHDKRTATYAAYKIRMPEKLRSCPCAHLRSGHFRALRDERFKRTEDGQVRIVYVNPCIVGNITPYTVDSEEVAMTFR